MGLTRHLSCILYAFLLITFFSFFDYESDNCGSGSGSFGTCTYSFFFGDSVDHVSSIGSGVFVLLGIKSIDDVLLLFVLKKLVVESKVV